VGEELRQHEHQELHHQIERHALGDDQIGEVIDASMTRKKGEERATEEEGEKPARARGSGR
jgi:hypothetical protein